MIHRKRRSKLKVKMSDFKLNQSKKIFINISCFYAMMVFAISLTMASPILIEISNCLGRNIEYMGIIFSSQFAGFIVGAFLSSFLGNYMSRKRTILFFYLLLSISVFAVAFSLNFVYLNVAIFFMGVSGGFIEAQVSSLTVEVNQRSEGLFINLTQVFFGIGAFIGPFLSSSLVSKGINWRYSYVIVSILCIVNFIYFIFLKVPDMKRKAIKAAFNISKRRGLNKNTFVFLFLAFAIFFYVCGEIGLASWTPTFLRLNRGFSSALAGRVLSFFWLSIMFGRLIIGFLTKRINMFYILIFITLLAVFSILIGIYSSYTSIIVISFIFSGLFASGVWPLIVVMGGMKYPTHKNFVISLLIMTGGIGGLFSPWFIGKMYEKHSLFYGMNFIYIFLTVELVFLLLLFFIEERKKRKKAN